MSERAPGHAQAASVVEAGVHGRGLQRRHEDRVLPVHELIVVQSGTLPIAEDGRRFAVQSGEWVLLKAGRRHYGYADIDADTWFYWVCFSALDGDGSGLTAPRGRQAGLVARPDRLRVLFEQMLEDQQATILTPRTAQSYLHLVLVELLVESPVAAGSPAAAQLARRAASFIGTHLTDADLATARIADALGCNADYLGRTFREALGETPTAHIHRLRIDRACRLFRSTGWSIERITTEVGFTDVRHFRRVFRRWVGLTPRQFQRLRPVAALYQPLTDPPRMPRTK